jgi:predicted Zn-dependent protease
LDPAAFLVDIELGNLLLKRGAPEQALRAYSDALKHAPEDQLFPQPIVQQVARFGDPSLAQIPPLRNPFLE